MCRLFGMHVGASALPATFWLLEAPDSLAAQSRRNPDGAGIGCFTADGTAVLDKAPRPAWADPAFALAARELTGTTFVAHVRYASTGGLTTANTHPFLQRGRLLAHNGVVEGLDRLDARLAALGAQALVEGQTDSERVFALITAETARHGGDLEAGLVTAVGWIGDTLPLYALNLVISTATELWALRSPATHELYVLARPPGGRGSTSDLGNDHPGTGQLEGHTTRISARSARLAERPAVIVASERMDDDPGWRLLQPGELVHVSADLTVSSGTPFDPPRHQLRLSDLDQVTTTSQHPEPATGP